jgi:glycosyltransferase involved in cell wall biosynthesis
MAKTETEITIIAFNIGYAGAVVNGPGMCLYNFCNLLSKYTEYRVNVFVKLPPKGIFGVTTNVYPLNNAKELSNAILRSDVIHMWSGIGAEFSRILDFAQSLKKTIFIGPNVLDGVKLDEEKKLLSRKSYDHIFVVNDRLRFLVSRLHNIDLEQMSVLQVGPDLELWKPTDKPRYNKILWKGNAKQAAKDIHFGLEVQKMLPQYEFEFLGYKKPYDYMSHIEEAKRYRLYMCTSISETMCLALAEQWAAAVPSVTHPKVYLHGRNYQTGIITNRTPEDYAEAIQEIMENHDLWEELSIGAYFESKRFDLTSIIPYKNAIRELA